MEPLDASMAAAHHGVPRVLIVDDELDHAEICAALLRRRGYNVAVAMTGLDAIELAHALVRAPKIFTTAPIAADYRVLFPDAIGRMRARAEAILRHQIDIFGVSRAVGERIDWLRDPLTGRRCDGDGLFPAGVDPKGSW